MIAAGLWVDNAVSLMCGHTLKECGRVELCDQQPRSVTAMKVAGSWVLIVGTISGQVSQPVCVKLSCVPAHADMCT